MELNLKARSPGGGGMSAWEVAVLLLVGAQCLHVVALKSQLFTRGDALDYSSRKVVDYKTLYLNQKVSFEYIICSILFRGVTVA